VERRATLVPGAGNLDVLCFSYSRTNGALYVGVLGTLSHESLAQFKASLERASADRRAAIVMPDQALGTWIRTTTLRTPSRPPKTVSTAEFR
jgi:hypothetical protein